MMIWIRSERGHSHFRGKSQQSDGVANGSTEYTILNNKR